MLGKMGWSPAAFGRSTLADVHCAVEGWLEQEQEQWQWQRYNTRDLIFWLSQKLDHGRIKEPDQLFALPMDTELKRARHKKMPRAKIIRPDGTAIE